MNEILGFERRTAKMSEIERILLDLLKRASPDFFYSFRCLSPRHRETTTLFVNVTPL